MKIQSCLFLTITTKFEKRALKTKKISYRGKKGASGKWFKESVGSS